MKSNETPVGAKSEVMKSWVPAVKAVLHQDVVTRGEEGQQRGGDGRHAAGRHQGRIGVLKGRQLSVKRHVVGGVVHADVFQLVIAGLAGVFESGGLEHRQAHGSTDSFLGFSGMDQKGVDAMFFSGHGDSLDDWQG